MSSTTAPIEMRDQNILPPQQQVPEEQQQQQMVVDMEEKDKKKAKEEKKKKKKKKGHCCKLPTKWYQIITLIGWVVMIGFCIWYIYNSTINYYDSLANPTTSLSYTSKLPLAYPAMTICNWNSGDDDCEYCDLNFEAFYQLFADGSFNTTYDPDLIEKKKINQLGSNFNCYVINNHTSKALTTSKTGYMGSVQFYFTINRPIEDIPGVRVGLQISFHEVGAVPDLLAETNYAMTDLDNVYMLTKVFTKRLKTTLENPTLEDTRWESKYTNIEIIGEDDDGVYITVAYSSLVQNNIVEIVTGTMEGLLGDIAGILGLTMGIDLLKVLRGFLDIPYSVKDRTLKNIYETFN